jgi:aminoglycoside-2''-adenylyltransferase
MPTRIQLLRDGVKPAEDSSRYLERLGMLAEILAGIPWLLAGGLSIPLTLGRFYRRHYDIDVAFPLEEFPRVDAAMRGAGYYLTTYRPFSFFGAMRMALSVPVRVDGPFVRHHPRKLKYRDGTGARPHPNLLAVVEVMPYRVVDGCFASCDGRHRFPLVVPLEGHRVTASNGHSIPCFNLHYVGEAKKRIDEPKHTQDLAVIAARHGVT